MSYYYSKNSIENLKEQVNIVDVVGRVVELKKAGSYYKGLCPFHHEKTPSFHVSEERQYFTCFGCGAKGDVIGFVEKYYNLDFPEAAERLADQYGIALEKQGRTDEKLERYYEVNRKAALFFYRCFTGSKNPGLTYMQGREITPRILKKFGIGYADKDWQSLYHYLSSQGVSPKTMEELGLISTKNGRSFDRFRNRVQFPIINTRGKVIGFGGRALEKDAQAKYLNSPESRIFQKKNNLYGLNLTRTEARKEGYIILVEGYMDMISLYQSGILNVCASLGTALTENQARLLKRYTNSVVLSYDADAAGRRAALRGIEILRREGLDVRVLHVTDGKDPDEYVKIHGKEGFLDLISHALPYADYKLDAAKANYDLSDSESRIRYMREAVSIISNLDPLEQEEYKKKLSIDMEFSLPAIERELEIVNRNERENPSRYTGNTGRNSYDSRYENSRYESTDAYSGLPGPGPGERDRGDRRRRQSVLDEITMLEKTLIKLFLTDPSFLSRIQKYASMLKTPAARNCYETALEEWKNKGEKYDRRAVIDSLPDDEAPAIREIYEQVLIDPDQKEQIFTECLAAWKKTGLKKREEELINMLSMADEKEDQQRIRELSEELIRVQKEKGEP
ncbi:MAG: DNA primase [Eubacteriales bacterium]|nr:DNA primase [Eubacteriales bacterium]